MTELEKLLKRIQRYRDQNNLTKTGFGISCVQSPNLIARLETGNVTLKTIQRVSEWLDQQGKRKAA
jgi:hypothetical protein